MRLRSGILALGVFVASWGAEPAMAVPGGIPRQPLEGVSPLSPPAVTAEAWLLFDETFDQELASLNPDERRAMASTTKIMTALVALNRASLDEVVTIRDTAANVGEAEIGLVVDERWSLENLLTAMLVRSANDAAVAVSQHVGGSVAAFVELMNREAVALELANTHFANPHGLDAHGHYSSARDLLVMARAAMEIEFFAETVSVRSATFPNDPEGNPRTARSTNALLGTFEGAIGVKTGFTDDAGLTFVAAAERDGRRLYAVVMGSDDHFADAASLLRYGFESFGLFSFIAAGEPLGMIRTSDELVAVVSQSNVEAFTSAAQAAEVEVAVQFDDGTPTVVVSSGGEEVERVLLDSEQSNHLPSLSDALSWASRYWDWLFGNE